MFNRNDFSKMRRSGFSVGSISKTKLIEAMLEILAQIPEGTTNLKKVVEQNLGIYGQMVTTREMNDIWDKTKRKAARLYPDKFILDARSALKWNDGSQKEIDKKISSSNFKKLNELAVSENCSVNAVISKLIKNYKD